MHPDLKGDLLIIDDNPDNAQVIGDLFSRTAQLNIRIAGSIDEAIATIQDRQPHLTVLNLHLQTDADGLQLLEMVKNGKHRLIKSPIVIASGSSNPRLRQRCFASPNVVAYLVKPYDITEQNISALAEKHLSAPNLPRV